MPPTPRDPQGDKAAVGAQADALSKLKKKKPALGAVPQPGGGGSGRPPMSPTKKSGDFPQASNQADLRELGVSGTRILAGLLYEETAPQLQGLNAYKTYQQMRFDATCAAGLKAVELPLRSARWYVEPASDDPKDVEKADYIHDMLWTFGSQSFDEIMRLAMTCLPFGFCLPRGEMVLDGIGRPRPIDEVKPGDLVLTAKGRARPVKAVSVRDYDGRVISLRLRGYPHAIRLTPEHRLPTGDGWKTAGEIKTGDRLLRPRPVLEPGGSYESGWIVGLFLAEGHRRSDAASTVQFTIHRDEIPEVTVRLDEWAVLAQAGSSPVGRSAVHLPRAKVMTYDYEPNSARVRFSSPRLRSLVDEWIGGDRASTKFLRKLPTQREFAQGVWEGWNFGDGTTGVDIQGHQFSSASTTSQGLAYQMQLLAGALGLPGALSFDPGGQDAYLRGTAHLVPAHYHVSAIPQRRMAWRRTPELVASARALREEAHLSYAKVAKHLGVSAMTIWHWLKEPDRPAKVQGLQPEVTDESVLHEVVGVSEEQYQGTVHDLEVEEDHTFCAGTMTVSNSWMEIVYEVIKGGQWNGKVGVDKLAWRHPNTQWRWNLGEVDGRQQLVSVTQLAPPYYEQIDIPRNKLLIFSHNKEGDLWSGWSLLRPAFKNWFFRDNLYKIQAIGLERSYMGVPIIELPAEFSQEMRDLAKQIVTTIRTDEQAGVTYPAPLKFDIKNFTLQGGAMQAAIEHHDTQIVASMLADFLKLGTKSVGSFSLSQDKSDLFLYALNGEANAFAEVMNLKPGIPQWIGYNFKDADDAMMPRLAHGDIGERNLEKLGRTIMALAQFGFLTPDDQTEDRLRQMLDFPERAYDFEDRDLWSLVQSAQPTQPDWRVADRQLPPRLRPATLVDPSLAAQQGAVSPLQGVAKQPGRAAVGGGKPTETATSLGEMRRMGFGEAIDRHMTQRAKIQDLLVRKRWQRVKGRPTEEQRMAMGWTEKFAEALDDFTTGIGKPPARPSEVAARARRPYEISIHKLGEGQELLSPSPVQREQSRIKQLAGRNVTKLQAALRVKPDA